MSTALEVGHLYKSFGGAAVTDDINMVVASGERRLIIGPNGAGKTTLFNQIAGEIRPDSGFIKVFGQDLTLRSARERPHFGLSRTYQIINLFNQDTVLHNVALALLGISKRRFSAFSKLRATDPEFARAGEVLRSVGLWDRAQQKVGEMSYGEQRRLEIGVAMSQSPRLLLLDEPLAGLSQGERVMVRDLIVSLPRETTIVMIEHDMDVALAFAEKISLLHHGRLIVEGDRDSVVNHPRTRDIDLGH
jgi:branched-chain amino acid transport system ATP-binding protein